MDTHMATNGSLSTLGRVPVGKTLPEYGAYVDIGLLKLTCAKIENTWPDEQHTK